MTSAAGATLQEAAAFVQRIQAATKGRPSPGALGVRGWPTRKVAALQEVRFHLPAAVA